MIAAVNDLELLGVTGFSIITQASLYRVGLHREPVIELLMELAGHRSGRSKILAL